MNIGKLLLTLATAIGAATAADSVQSEEEILLGWRGETYKGNTLPADAWVENLAWSPRVFVYHSFLTPAEARHLRRMAAPQMRRSSVVGANGSAAIDPARTSYGTFLRRKQDPVIQRVQERVAMWTLVPPIHQEDMQVLRYSVGQEYKPHMDSLIDSSPRMATVLLYLADTQEGGETAFPDAQHWANPQLAQMAANYSQCAQGKVAFKPRLGDALLFYSIRSDGTHESLSMHTGCPVIQGIKWTATVWVHSQPFRPASFDTAVGAPPPDPGLCQDANDLCFSWKDQGECEKNPAFMMGSPTTLGMCRASCKVCEACAATTDDCYRRNREQGGWLVYNQTSFL